ncbi:LodA/GoxA family CTQ-dependent oxidase [Amycolatopsis sp. CA-230715]|uniref:LodA/GoxA family CTQ-dependent oxidase n=1 Tax=Amycolatopsis sp. CA-230715 TaxID=2745196 RepID=UPI001C0286D7|nr:LodA/GoxA family CTQ-dependent oxidase [Amycolatopsis sp. CA-230715]QWF84895.1 L-lysine 6-oxidase [Amycolatopsis sp. CA-230715]
MSDHVLEGLAASVSIFPAIGVARVGNTGPGDTTDDYYLPPEGIGRLPTESDGGPPFDVSGFRDRQGRLRKQAATFALYHEDRREPLRIGTALPLPDGGSAQIVDVVWTAHLANKKAAWYQFEGGVGEKGYPPRHPLRNADVRGEDRRGLIIDPGPRTVSTRGTRTGEFDRNDGDGRSTFPPDGPDPDRERITTLGRITAGDDGGLLLLGGAGVAYTTSAAPALGDDDNNDHWWDDVSDGPVSATMVVRVVDQRGEQVGPEHEIRLLDTSWAIVAPPSYAPEVVTLVTLYDTLFDMAVRHEGIRPGIYREGQWQQGYRPHYPTEIEPILRRATEVPWVVAVPPKVHTFDLDRLGTKDPRFDQIRRYLFESLRPPQAPNTLSSPGTGYRLMPYIAGDDISSQQTAKFHTLTPTQYFLLGQWADGNFRTADETPNPMSGPEWHPGHRLTAAALGNSSGPPFSPGIEMGWLSRVPAVYAKPFRFRFAPVANLPVEAGRLSLATDPADGLEPGDVTKYMSVPWQADFNGCAVHESDGHHLWWWPAHRPMFVYARREKPGAVSEKDEWNHVGWIGTVRDQTAADYVAFADRLEMAEHWHELGFVMHNARIGPRDDTEAPDPPRFVEVRRTLPRPGFVLDDHNRPRD